QREEMFVEPGRSGPESHPAPVVDGDGDVGRQVLVRPQVIDQAAAALAVDEGGVEPPDLLLEAERAVPGHRLAPEPVDVGVILDEARASCPRELAVAFPSP